MSVIRYRRTIHYSEPVAKLNIYFLLFAEVALLFPFWEHENRVIVPVKGDYGIKTLALLALESFEQFRVSVGEQVFDFIIREGAVCFQAEHGQTALRVVAADDLAVKLHRPRSALGTLAAGIPAGEQLVARQQFGGNFPCICLNLPAEVIGGQFPTLDACQFLFPFARHGDIGNTHRLHDRVKGKPFFGGGQATSCSVPYSRA